jgi:hypothetical protein
MFGMYVQFSCTQLHLPAVTAANALELILKIRPKRKYFKSGQAGKA